MVNIFCANLHYSISDTQLMDCFAQYGTVDRAELIRDRETGRSRGFGFVEMPNEQEAALAIADLNGREWLGRRIYVRIATDRSQRPRLVRTEQTV